MRGILFYTTFILFISHSNTGLALKSPELLPTEDIPPQICKIDFGKKEIQSNSFGHSFCTGTIVSSKHILTASHCDQRQVSRGVVTCMSGETYQFTKKGIHHYDPDNIPSSRVNQNLNQVSLHDLAVIEIKGRFKTRPLPIAQAFSRKERDTYVSLLRERSCEIYGLGLNPFGTLGLAHGIQAPPYQGYYLNNPIEFRHHTGVAPHDSGGPIVCYKAGDSPQLLGVVSRAKDSSENVTSILTNLTDQKNADWISKVLNLNSYSSMTK